MERRKFLLGAGSAAVGASAVIGSGAFTSVQATRSVAVATADDSDAYLAFQQDGATNSAYVGTSDGSVFIDLDENSVDGKGVNPNSTTQINDLFSVQNQGTQPAVVYVDPDSISDSNFTFTGNGITIDPQATNRPNGDYENTSGISAGVEDDQISLTGGGNGPDYDAYQTLDSANNTNGVGGNDGTDADALEEFVLEVGESFEFGLYVNADENVDSNSSINEDIEIIADATLVPDNYAGKNS